jgi:hypothetical protein
MSDKIYYVKYGILLLRPRLSIYHDIPVSYIDINGFQPLFSRLGLPGLRG